MGLITRLFRSNPEPQGYCNNCGTVQEVGKYLAGKYEGRKVGELSDEELSTADLYCGGCSGKIRVNDIVSAYKGRLEKKRLEQEQRAKDASLCDIVSNEDLPTSAREGALRKIRSEEMLANAIIQNYDLSTEVLLESTRRVTDNDYLEWIVNDDDLSDRVRAEALGRMTDEKIIYEAITANYDLPINTLCTAAQLVTGDDYLEDIATDDDLPDQLRRETLLRIKGSQTLASAIYYCSDLDAYTLRAAVEKITDVDDLEAVGENSDLPDDVRSKALEMMIDQKA